MFELKTIPSMSRMFQAHDDTPDYMHPNEIPWAIIAEGILPDSDCDKIIAAGMARDDYRYATCNAISREFARPLPDVLDPVVSTALAVNKLYWNYELDEQAAWMQTYEVGNDYELHTDAQPGQMRKLTAVALLSEQSAYGGGILSLRIEPREYIVSKERGTIVVFPSWLPHKVGAVTRGLRQTVNLGFWGPNFR